jgi:uncharacterized membrane protein YidH (DUF202 family)
VIREATIGGLRPPLSGKFGIPDSSRITSKAVLFMPMPLLLLLIIITLVIVLIFWRFKQPKSGMPWIETRSDLQVWLLVLAAFVAGILIAYVLFAPVAGG